MALINGYDPSTDPLWSSVTFFLGIDGTSVVDLKSGTTLSRNNVTLSPMHVVGANSRSVLFPSSGNPFISLPDDPTLVFGTGDFTIEWSFYPVGIAAGNGFPAIPVMSWGGTTSNSAANLDILLYSPDSVMSFNAINYQTGVTVATPATSTYLNKQTVFALVRKSGLLSFYANGVRLGNPVSHTKNITHPISAPMYIGRRQGGGNGEITWNMNGYYSAFRMTKVARYDGASYTVPADFVALPPPNNTARVHEAALIRENNPPARVSKSVNVTLVQTEPPKELRAATVTKIIELALIKEGAGVQRIGRVSEMALVQVEAPAPADAANIAGSRMSVLVDDPTQSYVGGVHENALVLVEGPIVEQRAMKVTHATLALDLERGIAGVGKVVSATIAQTELPSRDPYRTKIASLLHASRTALYVNPLDIIANRRYQAFTTMSGLAVVYPARSVSPIRVPSAVSQTAVSVNGRPLNDYRSFTRVPQTFIAAAAKIAKSNPVDVQSPTRELQIVIKSASSTSLRNPQSITASFRFQQISTMVGSKTTYQGPAGIASAIRARSVDIMSASRYEYPSPPTSNMRVNGTKAESATYATTFLNPLDPRLTSTETVCRAVAEVASIAPTMADPINVKSTQTALQVTIETGSSVELTDPIGIIPGGRNYQTGLLIGHSATDYNNLPISFTNIRHFEAQAALGGLDMRDPATMKDTRMVTQSLMLTAVQSNAYSDPLVQTHKKRRTSSAQVGRKPA